MHRIGRLGAVLFFLLLHVSFGHSLGIGVPQRSSSSRRLFLPFQLPSGTHPQQRRDSGPWIGLRDYLIRHVFSLSKGHGADGESLLSGGGKQCAKTRPPANLLASYGGDVVLRFSIASPDEAKALAEASNILFLDIWDFREDWVDIRLAKDVVRGPCFQGSPGAAKGDFSDVGRSLRCWACYLHPCNTRIPP